MISIFPRHQNIQCHYSGSVDQYQLEEPVKLFKQTGLLVSWNAYPLDNILPVVQTLTRQIKLLLQRFCLVRGVPMQPVQDSNNVVSFWMHH